MKDLTRPIILFLKENRYARYLIFILFQIIPNVDFYYKFFEVMEWDINWQLVRESLPGIFYALMTGFLFLLYIHAQAGYYEVKDQAKLLMRLNQLYKERFKMIKYGDQEKLFSKDFEKERWRSRLYQKEKDKSEVDAFLDEQYKFNYIDYPTNKE